MLGAPWPAGVVHRVLKPADVLIAADGPRVIDVGIARAADAGPLTGTGLRIGSPGFMAPEQVLGLPTTVAADVFALGALIAHAGSATTPFGGGPGRAALHARTWALVEQRGAAGPEVGLDIIGRFMRITADCPPLRAFAENEQTVALRVLMADGQAVNTALRTGFTRAFAVGGVEVQPEQVEIMVQFVTALEWAPIVIGGEPAIDRAVTLMRHLVDRPSSPASGPPADPPG